MAGNGAHLARQPSLLPAGRVQGSTYLFLGNVQFASNDFCHFQFFCRLRKHGSETVQSLLEEPREMSTDLRVIRCAREMAQ